MPQSDYSNPSALSYEADPATVLCQEPCARVDRSRISPRGAQTLRAAYWLLVFLAATYAALAQGDTGREQYLETGQLCAQAEDPAACLQSYGFDCHRSRAPDVSLDAYELGCNLDLGDGRMHFVQLLHDDGASTVERESTYAVDHSEYTPPALQRYLEHEMEGFRTSLSGSGSEDYGHTFRFRVGSRRADGAYRVRAVCGSVLSPEHDEAIRGQTRAACESRLMLTVKRLSQERADGSYVVASPAEFTWDSRQTMLVSGDYAFIVEGRYEFSAGHVPCRRISDCCSRDGSLYLDSCRVPTESELKAIDTCLDAVGTRRSEEFDLCLRDAGVRVGCERQNDGSQVCS